MLRLLRLQARVSLGDPGPTLSQARAAAAAGDDSWEQWLFEYERGDALIVRLELSLEFSTSKPEVIRIANPGVFVEKHPDPPKVELQIAEVASKDFCFLARDLRTRGHDVDAADLSELYVHVELQTDVLRALETTAGDRQEARRSPHADVRLSHPER